MKKNISILTISVLVFALAIGGATLAWFTDDSEATNTFVTGDVAITLHDKLAEGEAVSDFPADGIENVTPGDEYGKQVWVSSEGSVDTYVRVKLTPKWTPAIGGEVTLDTALDTALVELNLDLTKWKFDDGWYYYTEVLEENDETDKLLDGLTFNTAIDNNYANASFTIDVEAEAIQATNGAALAKWGVDPSTL